MRKKRRNNKKNDWKEWETLAYEYVRTLYKDANIFNEKHTDVSHDLGFDGIWLLRSNDRKIMKLVLMDIVVQLSRQKFKHFIMN